VRPIHRLGCAVGVYEGRPQTPLKVLGRTRLFGELEQKEAVVSLATLKPDLVFYAGDPSTGLTLLRRMRDNGANTVFFGGDTLNSPAFLGANKAVIADTYFVSPLAPGTAYPLARGFAARHLARFGRVLGGYGVLAHDATLALTDALTRVQAKGTKAGDLPGRTRVWNALQTTQLKAGEAGAFTGTLDFDGSGERRETTVFVYHVGADGVARVSAGVKVKR